MDSNDLKNLRPLSRRTKMILIGLLAVCVGGGLWLALRSSTAEIKRVERPVMVEVEAARPAAIARTFKATGVLKANQSVTIKPQVNGLVSRIFIEGGQEVKAGDPILSIDDRKYQNKLKETKARLAFAELEFHRYDKLNDQKLGIRKNHEKAASARQEAEAAVDQAKKELEDSTIKAPFEGFVSFNEISVGAAVNENTELFILTDVDPIKVDFKVPAILLQNLTTGQEVQITIDSFVDHKFEAYIEAIDSKVDPNSHTIAVRVRVDNKNNLLRPGLVARGLIQIGAKDSALVLPTSAVQVNDTEASVYKVSYYAEKDLLVAIRQNVTTGLSEDDKTEILKGLKEGDLIVTVGNQKVRGDGVPIAFEGQEDYIAQVKHENEQLEKRATLEAPKTPITASTKS